ncbi:MAG: hypothetical protein QY326_02585 [Bdellovibrionota bacterium]|nr:MAG: hypothetical protein QY326_02585 [Bdellovibrionota bacterium]
MELFQGIALDVMALILTMIYLARLLYISFRDRGVSRIPNCYQRGLKLSLVHQQVPLRRSWMPGAAPARL